MSLSRLKSIEADGLGRALTPERFGNDATLLIVLRDFSGQGIQLLLFLPQLPVAKCLLERGPELPSTNGLAVLVITGFNYRAIVWIELLPFAVLLAGKIASCFAGLAGVKTGLIGAMQLAAREMSEDKSFARAIKNLALAVMLISRPTAPSSQAFGFGGAREVEFDRFAAVRSSLLNAHFRPEIITSAQQTASMTGRELWRNRFDLQRDLPPDSKANAR
ncbi:hypothetical protein [Anatilimnocola floriformis]|uniref:hypothetical protein n=1 Tax=Anatilimnocola floriformis TaxID=2948575 RepID=UPI0020C2F41F|nr:hypothetical protein [Anatilimnocola floriformis]